MAQLPGLYWAKELQLANIKTVGPLMRPSETAYAVAEGNILLQQQLNEGLAVLRETGALKQLTDKWYGVLTPLGIPKSRFFLYIFYAVGPLLLLLMLIGLWSRTLKRQVNFRTQELAVSKERYRSLVNNIPYLVYRAKNDRDWSAEFMSDYVEKLTGYPASDFIDHKVRSLSNIIDPLDFEFVYPKIQAAINDKIGYELEYRIAHKNGNTVWVHEKGHGVYDEEGELLYLDGAISDITERKQVETSMRDSEARYRELVDKMSDGVAVYEAVDDGQDFVFRDYNQAGERISGKDRDQVIGFRVTEVFPGVDAMGLLELLQHVWKTGQYMEFPSHLYQEGHVEQWMDNYVYRLPGGEIVAIYNDITERKLAEREKERLQRELQQKHKMEALGQLTGGIAHDFNNIIGIIMGNNSMALSRYGDDIPEKVVDYLNTSLRASERARDLISQVLAFSHSDSNDNADAQPLQFAPLIKENIKMLHSILPSSINIQLNSEDDLPDILMEPTKLQQLMMNLCINARDAMEGTGTLTIDLGWQRNVDAECLACLEQVKGDWIELSVSDTGSGMAPEILEHLIEPFFTTKEVGKGTGMGMAVLHGIVNSYGGHALVETQLGKGSHIRLLFPPSTEGDKNMPVSVMPSTEIPLGECRHVMVLDDEPELAEYISDLLELYDYRTTIITDSQQALSLYQGNPEKFDLLITDQTMPGLTGLELIKQIRKIRQDFPVILCSGYSDSIDKESALRLGFSFHGKPIDADRLVHLAGELLALKEKVTSDKSS